MPCAGTPRERTRNGSRQISPFSGVWGVENPSTYFNHVPGAAHVAGHCAGRQPSWSWSLHPRAAGTEPTMLEPMMEPVHGLPTHPGPHATSLCTLRPTRKFSPARRPRTAPSDREGDPARPRGWLRSLRLWFLAQPRPPSNLSQPAVAASLLLLPPAKSTNLSAVQPAASPRTAGRSESYVT